ncbi:MAG: MATE family efflux transporter [Clostridia bacterium]|nr:MATE family efflux transporter [Clostridia bacterium]
MRIFKGRKPFYKSVFLLGYPIALQTFITVAVGLLDNVMISRVSESAFAATSLASAFISFFQIFCMGLGMGASVLISRYLGMIKIHEDEENADRSLKQTVSIALRLTLLIALVFALFTFFAPNLVMKMYTDDAILIALGCRYLKYSVLTFFFLGLSLVATIILRCTGQSRYPMFVSIGAFFVNLLFNYMFIFGNFGAPRLGIEGAAIATLIARIAEAAAVIIYLLFVDKKISFKFKHFFMKTKSIIGEYMHFCIPVLISDAMVALGNNAIVMVIGHLGAVFVAANSITTTTQQLSTVVIQGVCQAGAIITGQTLGKGKKDEAEEQGWLFLLLGLALGALSALFIILTKTPMVNLFGEKASPETIQTAYSLLNSISLIIVFQATNSIMTKGVLRGGGDTLMLMLTDNIFLWVIALPLGIVAGFYWKMTPFWVYFFLKSDQIIKTLWCIYRLKTRKWIKRISTGSK